MGFSTIMNFAILFLLGLLIKPTGGNAVDLQCPKTRRPVCCQKGNGPLFNKGNPCLCFKSGGSVRAFRRCTDCDRIPCSPGWHCKKNEQKMFACVPTIPCPCTKQLQITCCLTRDGRKVVVPNPCLCTYCGTGGIISRYGRC